MAVLINKFEICKTASNLPIRFSYCIYLLSSTPKFVITKKGAIPTDVEIAPPF